MASVRHSCTQFKKKKQVSLDINNFKGRWPFELSTPEKICILTLTTRGKFNFNTTPETEDMASYI